MALPPHIIWNRIQEMPEGPEKEKRLKSFNFQMKIASIAYPIMFLVMFILTAFLLWIAVWGGLTH